MKRRDFIKKSAVTGTIISTPRLMSSGIPEAAAVTDRPLVALAGSNDPALRNPKSLDALMTTEEVRDLVFLALDRDTSNRSLKAIVPKNGWAIVKPNLVTCPVTMSDFHAEGIEHWWLVTDLRVVKAIVEYIVEKIGPKRVSIAEGPPWFSSGGKLNKEEFVDGWHCKWKEFGNLSYAEVVDTINARQTATKVDIIDLNEDEAVYVENFDPHNTGIGAYQDVKPGDPDASDPLKWSKRKGIYYPKSLIDCDVLISAPVLKTHSSAGVTLMVKNLVGCLHSQMYGKGNSKAPIHQGSQLGLIRGVADLGASLPIHYSVAEGVWATIQQHQGQNGVGIHHNVIVAGGDVVATEGIAMMVMGYHPLDCDMLRLLYMKKIGEWHPDRIDIAGPPIVTLRRNFERAANTYFARGIRKWIAAGPLKKGVDKPGSLKPKAGDTVEKTTWRLLDGDALIDAVVNSNPPFRLQDCLLFDLPESAEAKKGSIWYLTLNAKTERKDLCGQLLVGVTGGDLKVFFGGSEVAYPSEPRPYDPTPNPFLKFMEGDNQLVLEITKTTTKKEPVRFAANLCDLDGDRINGITLDPDNEKLAMPVKKA